MGCCQAWMGLSKLHAVGFPAYQQGSSLHLQMRYLKAQLTRLLSGKGSGSVSDLGSGLGGTTGTSSVTGRGRAVTRRRRLARASSAASLAAISCSCSAPRASVCSLKGCGCVGLSMPACCLWCTAHIHGSNTSYVNGQQLYRKAVLCNRASGCLQQAQTGHGCLTPKPASSKAQVKIQLRSGVSSVGAHLWSAWRSAWLRVCGLSAPCSASDDVPDCKQQQASSIKKAAVLSLMLWVKSSC
jgi:hypothetical protein